MAEINEQDWVVMVIRFYGHERLTATHKKLLTAKNISNLLKTPD